MSQTEKKKRLFCYFKPRFLWCLEPFVDWHRGVDELRFLDGTVFVEPAPFSGVFVGCVMSHALAVFHDPDGYASEAMTLDLPDAVFTACQPPTPIAMNYCGTQYSIDLPEWAQPGRLYAYDVGLHVVPKMRHPVWSEEDDEFHPCLYSIPSSSGVHHVGRDYRAKAGLPADWRRPLQMAKDSPQRRADGQPLAFSPEIVNLFSRVREMYGEEGGGIMPVVFHRLAGTDEAPGATIVTIEGQPAFIGCYMPMKQTDPQPVSDFFLQKMPMAPK